MDKRAGSVYTVHSGPPERIPSVLYSKDWYFDTDIEGTELDALLPDSLSIISSCNQMPFTPKVETDGKTSSYLHRHVRKVIPIPVLETHDGNCTCVNLQGFLFSAWKQHLLWQLGHWWPNQPPHSARHCTVCVNPSQSSSLGACVIPCTV